MWSRLINAVTWWLVSLSVVILVGGLLGRPILLAAVPTGSMLPVLRPGDLILVMPYLGTRLSAGDIIIFRTEKDSGWIVHRIVGGSAREGFVTRGDNNRDPDPHRVYPRHVVGTVPTAGERAWAIRRGGVLSVERGPLSNPAVAGAALLLGLYLVFADARDGWRVIRLRLRQPGRPGPPPRAVLAGYGAMALAVFLITLVSTTSLGSRTTATYKSVESLSARVRLPGLVAVGTTQVDTVEVRNPSPVPLVVALDSSQAAVTWQPSWQVVPPRQSRKVTLTMTAQTPGELQVMLRQALYLPLLPVPVLQALSGLHWYLPVLAVALVPAGTVLVLALFDSRSRLQLASIRLRMALWFRH